MHTIRELNTKEQLDNPLKLYRGTRVREKTAGLSWTTNRERAIWFANRWQEAPGSPVLQVVFVDPAHDVIGPFHQRGEDEYILFNPDNRIITYEEIEDAS